MLADHEPGICLRGGAGKPGAAVKTTLKTAPPNARCEPKGRQANRADRRRPAGQRRPRRWRCRPRNTTFGDPERTHNHAIAARIKPRQLTPDIDASEHLIMPRSSVAWDPPNNDHPTTTPSCQPWQYDLAHALKGTMMGPSYHQRSFRSCYREATDVRDHHRPAEVLARPLQSTRTHLQGKAGHRPRA
jgi:hypothetical protein